MLYFVNTYRRNSSSSFVVSECPADLRSAGDLAICFWWPWTNQRQVTHALMRSIVVLVLNVLTDDVVEVLRSNQQEAVKALNLE